MFEDIPLGLLGELTPSVLLGLCILLILIGRLVPVRTHDREIKSRDQQITFLQEALAASLETEQRRVEQIDELMEHSRVSTAIIQALPGVDRGGTVG